MRAGPHVGAEEEHPDHARRLQSLSWDVLVLPVGVLVMAVGLYLMRSGEE